MIVRPKKSHSLLRQSDVTNIRSSNEDKKTKEKMQEEGEQRYIHSCFFRSKKRDGDVEGKRIVREGKRRT